MASEEATLQQQEASLDASLRFFDTNAPSHPTRPSKVTFDGRSGTRREVASATAQDARFQDAYLRSLSASRPITTADAAAPVDSRVANLLAQSRRNDHAMPMPMPSTTTLGSYTSPASFPSSAYPTSLRTAPSTTLAHTRSTGVTSGQRDFLAEHRRWLSSYRQDMATFDATHSTSMANAAVFRPRGPMQLHMDNTGVHVQNRATLVP